MQRAQKRKGKKLGKVWLSVRSLLELSVLVEQATCLDEAPRPLHDLGCMEGYPHPQLCTDLFQPQIFPSRCETTVS